MPASIQHAYGVEFSGSRATVIHAYRRKGETVFETLAEGVDTAADPRWKPIADQILRDQQSDRAVVAAAVPAQDSFIRPLATPFSSVRKAASILPSLLDVQLPFPLEQCRHQFVNLHPSIEGPVRAVALAVPNDRLQSMLEQLHTAGVDPDVVDQEALALWRYTQKIFPSVSSRTRIILYLGHDRTVAIVGNNQEPNTAFSARTPWNNDLESSQRDRLVLRLRQFLAGAMRGSTRSETAPEYIVSGPLAATGSELLQKNLEVEAARWKMADHHETLLARSLADSLLNPDSWSANLRTETFAHPNSARREQQRQRKCCWAISATAVLLIAAGISSVMLAAHRHTALQTAIQQTALALTGSPYMPRGQELFLAEQHVKISAEQFVVFQKFLEPTAYPLFAEMLALSRERNVQLNTLSVRTDSVIARGASADWNDADTISQPLMKHGWKVEVERNDAGNDERVHFTVRAQK